LATAQQVSPGTEFLAAHTAGEFTERKFSNGGLVVLLIASDRLEFDIQRAKDVARSPVDAAKGLCAHFSDLAQTAAKKGLGFSTTFLLVDGLAGTGEKLVRELMHSTRMFQQIVGGAAGDDGAFEATSVGALGEASRDTAAALHLFDKAPIGIGIGHGHHPRTDPMTVTRANGNVLYELDGRPAFEVYRDYALRSGVQLEPTSAVPFFAAHSLGVYFLDELHHARAAIQVMGNGALKLVGEITEGTSVCILDGEPEAMILAAGRAAREAKANLGANDCAGVLVFDCVCRGLVLKEQFQREVEAISSVFPGAPVAGFLTYGEIARFKSRLDGWHNSTAVVAAIPA
jgi:hypothetical protein